MTCPSAASPVTYDQRSLLINGKRKLILSGAMHYSRSGPEQWERILRLTKEAGINTVETYVFWHLHEKQRGVYDFTDRLDIRRFIATAGKLGLHVILRMGPYVCAESNLGGFPSWLLEEEGIQFRTWNEAFMRVQEKWVRFVRDYLDECLPHRGGSIILVQFENEYANVAKNYGEDGARYLDWCIRLSKELNFGVPTIMCLGGAPGSLETINGWRPYEFLPEQLKERPDQPAFCSEHWTGWYNLWGFPQHHRDAGQLAHGLIRFIAGGGCGINYYMWFAGSNFGRECMYLQTTDYDYNSPLNEYGLPTDKYYHSAKLHHLLLSLAEDLFASARPAIPAKSNLQPVFEYPATDGNSIVFLCNDAEVPAMVTYDGKTHAMPTLSAVIIKGGKVVFKTWEWQKRCKTGPDAFTAEIKSLTFSSLSEPMPSAWPAAMRTPFETKQLVQQLPLTKDQTDYCWYETDVMLTAAQVGKGVLTLTRFADYAHIFVDGRLVTSGPLPLVEDRGDFETNAYRVELPLVLKPGKHRLSILSCALGLIKGDWMIGNKNMATERKGLWGDVLWNGRALKGRWSLQPGLWGERTHLPVSHLLPAWKTATAKVAPLTWLCARFPRPKTVDVPLALNLVGMGKGMAWLNGRCLGRYWLQPATAKTPAIYLNWIYEAGVGEPTQQRYLMPQSWFEEQNTLILFEEIGGDTGFIQIEAPRP